MPSSSPAHIAQGFLLRYISDMPGGRPSTYEKRTADSICSQIAEGRSLVAICSAKDMPTTTTVYDWLQKHPDFADSYTRARETQAEGYAAEIIEIADTPVLGVKRVLKGDGSIEEHEGDMIEHRKVQIDARKWTAAKLLPKKYGDKQQLELSGSLNISFKDVTDDDLLGELLEAITLGVIKLPEGLALPELTVAADIDAALDEAGI